MPQSTYLNFDIQIIARLDGTFRARVASMPLEITDEEPSSIFTMSQSTENLIQRFLNATNKNPSPMPERLARQLGISLFHTLFSGEILEAYLESLEIAHQKFGCGLRIRLNLEHALQLSYIPWELLHNTRDFIALTFSTSLIRYPRQIISRRREVLTLPLRVLLIISSPDGFPPLNVNRERRLIDSTTESLRRSDQISVDVLENPTSKELNHYLKIHHYHILHFIGYTQANPETNMGYLALHTAEDDPTPDLIRADSLARQISEENTIRLVILDAPHTTASASIIADNFVARGLPAVITIQFPISPVSLTQFIAEIYRTIAENRSVDEAVNRARYAISSRNPIEWASPILYNHSVDGLPFLPPVRKFSMAGAPILWISAGTILGTLLLLFFIIVIFGNNDFLANAEDSDNNEPPPSILNVDLSITSIALDPNPPRPDENFTFHVQIENLGTLSSSPTDYALYLHNASSTIQSRGEIPTIASDETLTFEISASVEDFGAYIAQIILDPDDHFNELNEYNNIHSIPFLVTENVP